jgi:iron complex outermembrane receptor protein
LNLDGNYEMNYQTYSVADGKWNKNTVGTYDRGGQLGAKVTAALKTGNWDNSVVVSYVSGYSANSLSSPTYCATQKVAAEYLSTCERIDAGITTNYSLTYSGFKNTKLNFFVGNVFGAEAPTSWRDGWSPNFRTFYLNGTYKF